ncbi:hypothetical protein [Solidesulfovibrio sp.]|uniref:hypothetical protein n=1 Tax=Solidesulfovibrio sp. TaxID=2910990 RepID=UPI0026112448|nr:hypothetical protein [Solidesulfovibrio sp.]
MAGATDVARSIQDLQERQGQALDALSGAASGAGQAGREVSDFFHSPDNLLALCVCAAALVGIYRLLRSENIIPAPSGPSTGSVFAALLARRLALKLIVLAVVAALGLALLAGRLSGLAEALKRFF